MPSAGHGAGALSGPASIARAVTHLSMAAQALPQQLSDCCLSVVVFFVVFGYLSGSIRFAELPRSETDPADLKNCVLAREDAVQEQGQSRDNCALWSTK